MRIAAEFQATDIQATNDLIAAGSLNLDGLISDTRPAGEAKSAYPEAFSDPACLKMVLDWSAAA